MAKRKINTMAELAGEIGVSRPTLSRYFQNPSAVRDATADRIRRGLERVDYVPNFFATRMNRKSTGLIGFIVPHLKDLFFTSLLDAIDLAAMEQGFTLIALCSHGDPGLEVAAIGKLLSMNAEGALVAPLGLASDRSALDRLARGLPLVFVDSRVPEIEAEVSFVGTDNLQSIGLATEYLCRAGPPPVFLAMPRINANALERETAYRRTMERLGHEPVIVGGGAGVASWAFEALAFDLMEAEFSRGRLTEASILAANDRLAFGAIRAASRHGLMSHGNGPPGPVRIAGHDDHPFSRFTTPALTTVAQDIDAIGRESVALLTRRLGGGAAAAEPASIALGATLIVRESA